MQTNTRDAIIGGVAITVGGAVMALLVHVVASGVEEDRRFDHEQRMSLIEACESELEDGKADCVSDIAEALND